MFTRATVGPRATDFPPLFSFFRNVHAAKCLLTHKELFVRDLKRLYGCIGFPLNDCNKEFICLCCLNVSFIAESQF